MKPYRRMRLSKPFYFMKTMTFSDGGLPEPSRIVSRLFRPETFCMNWKLRD